MRTLTPSEKRTIRIAAIGIAAYLALFGTFKIWQFFHHQRVAYLQLVDAAQNLKLELKPYDDKVAVVKKLMENFHLDPAKLSRPTVVADASAAIQKAAMGGGIQVGPIRESAAQSSSKALGTIQFEGAGQVAAAMSLLHNLPNLGYPLVVDAVQITSDPTRPGQVKLSLTIIVLDFEQWKKAEAGHA